jgi:hypothetical protein
VSKCSGIRLAFYLAVHQISLVYDLPILYTHGNICNLKSSLFVLSLVTVCKNCQDVSSQLNDTRPLCPKWEA